MRPATPLVFALLLLFVVGTVWFHVRSTACTADTSSIPSQGDAAAEIVETSCDGFGGSDVIAISIVSSKKTVKTKRVMVFKYDPSSFSGPINVSWANDKELAISVDRVDSIETKETQVDGYAIHYNIGAVGPLVARNSPRVQR
jgi:hypothetical protein